MQSTLNLIYRNTDLVNDEAKKSIDPDFDSYFDSDNDSLTDDITNQFAQMTNSH